MPTNLYGPNDNYTEGESHVMAALIKRFTEAKEQNLPSVTNWGTGKPLREFLHVDDLAAAIYQLLETYDDDSPINIGSGEEISIKDLSDLIQKAIGYEGEVFWDEGKPDGVMRKKLSIDRQTRLAAGFIKLERGGASLGDSLPRVIGLSTSRRVGPNAI